MEVKIIYFSNQIVYRLYHCYKGQLAAVTSQTPSGCHGVCEFFTVMAQNSRGATLSINSNSNLHFLRGTDKAKGRELETGLPLCHVALP